MEKVTYESLKEVFGSVYLPWYDTEYKEYGGVDEDTLAQAFFEFITYGAYNEIDLKLKEAGLEHITQEGGGEGGTEDCYTILKYKGEFYKLTYWYRSHHGFDGLEDSDFIKVKPRETVVTVYD